MALPPFVRKLGDTLRDRPALAWLLVGVTLLILHGAALAGHLSAALDPNQINDDARQQIFPFFHYSQPERFQNDYLGQYFLDCMPFGYRALYTIGAYVWDAAALSKAVPYALLLVTIVSIAVASARLGSRWSALASVSLILGSTWFMSRMVGGLPRSFASPCIALGIALLATGRLRWLAALVPITAAFYPAAAALLGLAAAFAALALPESDRGDLAGWSLRKRFALLVGSAALTVVVLAPTAVLSTRYGHAVTPAMVKQWPEAGPGGRYTAEDRAPFTPFFPAAVDGARTGFGNPGGEAFVEPLSDWLSQQVDDKGLPPRRAALHDLVFIAIILGGASLATRNPAARRMLMVAAAAFVGHLVSRFVHPYLYLPTRYVQYPLPLLAVALLPAGAAELGRLLPARLWERSRAAVLAASAALVLVLLGSTGSKTAGYSVNFKSDALFAAIDELPDDALVAGFPGGPIEDVPYSLRRQVFLSRELHQIFHTGFAEEARRRMRALIDATFATDRAPLLRLRDEFGVTHLVVQLAHLKGHTPKYFAPFQAWIADAEQRARGKEYEVLKLAPTAVFKNGRYAILDLRALPAS